LLSSPSIIKRSIDVVPEQTAWKAEKALDLLPLLAGVGGRTQALLHNPSIHTAPHRTAHERIGNGDRSTGGEGQI